MTVIAYRDGVLAADTGATRGSMIVTGIVKIVRVPNGDLAGACGDAGYEGAFLRWAADGCNGEPPAAKHEDSNWDAGLIYRADGEMIIYEPSGWFSMRPPYYAVGSGKEFAIGAMHAGANAVRAVEAAIAHDPWCRAEITVLRHS